MNSITGLDWHKKTLKILHIDPYKPLSLYQNRNNYNGKRQLFI